MKIRKAGWKPSLFFTSVFNNLFAPPKALSEVHLGVYLAICSNSVEIQRVYGIWRKVLVTSSLTDCKVSILEVSSGIIRGFLRSFRLQKRIPLKHYSWESFFRLLRLAHWALFSHLKQWQLDATLLQAKGQILVLSLEMAKCGMASIKNYPAQIAHSQTSVMLVSHFYSPAGSFTEHSSAATKCSQEHVSHGFIKSTANSKCTICKAVPEFAVQIEPTSILILKSPCRLSVKLIIPCISSSPWSHHLYRKMIKFNAIYAQKSVLLKYQ